MSTEPHQEIVVYDDVRRQGGGVGIWLGIWSFCFVGSMSIGFCAGAIIISNLSPSWGFYIIVIMLAFFLLVNVIAPETWRAPYRRSIAQYIDGEGKEEQIKRRVARGEVKLHISTDGPMWWWEEVWAGIILTRRMIFQAGFFVMTLYLAWMFAQVTLVVLVCLAVRHGFRDFTDEVATWCAPDQRLHVATTVGWPSRAVDRLWRTAGCSTFEGQPLQPCTRHASANRQHDNEA